MASKSRGSSRRGAVPRHPSGGRVGGQHGPKAARRPGAPVRTKRTGLFTWGAIALVVVVVVVVAALSQTGVSSTGGAAFTPRPVPARILHGVTAIPPSAYDAVGLSAAVTPPSVRRGQPALTFTGKPGVFVLDGEFCPFCAAERWAVVASLARFGTFSGLKTMQSSPADSYPKTQTFEFATTRYSSPYISARLLEMYGQARPTGARPVIRAPTTSEAALIARYDSASATSSGTVPFFDIGNLVFLTGSSFSPGVLAGLSRAMIAATLAHPSNPLAKLILGASNYISAGICSIDGGKPASVCASRGVRAAERAAGLGG